MNPEEWTSFIFLDECRFQTYAHITKLVKRSRNNRYSRKFVIETRKYRGSSVLVWGAIKGNGSRILVQCPQRLNSSVYQQVLDSGLFQLYGSHSVFVQDNAPFYKSRSTLNYPQSPDINIIENRWSILKSKVYRRSPKFADEFLKAIKKEYYSIDDDVFIALYDSIPRRLKAALQSKGGNTKY